MILAEAKRVIRVEAEALLALAESLNSDFTRGVELILSSTGRVGERKADLLHDTPAL